MRKLSVLSLIMLISSVFNIGVFAQNEAAQKIKKEVVLSLLPGNDNPRNSEGDFITLKSGKILYIYSHFIGKSGSDYGHARLASRYSTDGGKTWSKTDHIVVNHEGGMNVMSVSLLRLQNGNIALFYVRKQSKTDCIPMMRISTDEARTWGEPIACITDRKGYFVLNNNRVIQLKNGRLLMAVSLHETPEDSTWHEGGDLFSYYSDDNGATWRSGQSVPDPDKVIMQEPGLVELGSRDILMFIRTNAGVQYASHSTDNGVTWSPAQPTDIPSPLSPASMARIPSTRDLLMVWNNNGKSQKRTPLNIAISHDEGKTWNHMKTLEEDPHGTYCYTAIHFAGKYVLLAYADWATMGTTVVRLKVKDLYQ